MSKTLFIADASSIAAQQDFLAACLETLCRSRTAKHLLQDAARTGWHIGFSTDIYSDYEIDADDKIVTLKAEDVTLDMARRIPFFRNELLVGLMKALRDIWHENRHGGFDIQFGAEDILMLSRVRSADIDIMAVLMAWELRSANTPDLWRHLLAGDAGDVALAFLIYLERNPLCANVHQAMGAAFDKWFENEERVRISDHGALEYLDAVIEEAGCANPFGRERANWRAIEMLSCLPDRTAYLQGKGDNILRDPYYAGLDDSINQAHFMQIMHDMHSVTVAGVSFRDAALAGKIFPNGEDI